MVAQGHFCVRPQARETDLAATTASNCTLIAIVLTGRLLGVVQMRTKIRAEKGQPAMEMTAEEIKQSREAIAYGSIKYTKGSSTNKVRRVVFVDCVSLSARTMHCTTPWDGIVRACVQAS